jgi:hypothetical protein
VIRAALRLIFGRRDYTWEPTRRGGSLPAQREVGSGARP